MIWATVSSRSCLCCLYRVSPSLTTKNIISLISVLTIWWCSCVKLSLVLLKKGDCYDWQGSVGLCPLHFVLQGQTCLLLQVSLDFLLLHSSPLWWKGYLFLVLDLDSLVGLHRTIQLQLLQHYWFGHRFGSLWYWMVCHGNEQRLLCCFWYRIVVLHFRSFVDYDG